MKASEQTPCCNDDDDDDVNLPVDRILVFIFTFDCLLW